MGQKYGVKCSQCDFSFPVNIGHGMLGCCFFETNIRTGKPYFYGYIKSKRTIADIERIRETWIEVIEDETVYEKRKQWRGHGSAQYLCPKCGRMHNKFFFALIGSGGRYQPTYYCSTCRNKVVLVELKVSKSGEVTVISEKPIKWICPKCENDKFEQDLAAGITMYD